MIAQYRRALYIDPSLHWLAVIAPIVAQKNFLVDICRLEEEAFLKMKHLPYDLIICSCAMPGMGGESIIRLIRDAGIITPIIALCENEAETALMSHTGANRTLLRTQFAYISSIIDELSSDEVNYGLR